MADYSVLLCKLMAEKNISVVQLAARAKVAKQTITNMRMGHNSSRNDASWRPSPDTVARVATALGEPVNKWLEMAGHRPQFSADADQWFGLLTERLRKIDDPRVLMKMNKYLEHLTSPGQDKPDNKPVKNKPVDRVQAEQQTTHKKSGPPRNRQPAPQVLFSFAKPR